LVYYAIELRWNKNSSRSNDSDLDHPYGVGVLVSSVAFLIIFRANAGYSRYWEACGAVHHCMSKWMDATQYAAVFHLQNSNYDNVRPPSFYNHDELNKLNLTRDRTRHDTTDTDTDKPLDVHLGVNNININSSSVSSSGSRSNKNKTIILNNEEDRRLKSVYDCEKEHYSSLTFAGSPKDDDDNDDDDENSITLHRRSSSGSNTNSSNKRRLSLPKAPPPSPYRRQDSPLPKSVLGGQWDIIPPTPDEGYSSDILQRTRLNTKYFPSSQIHNKNFAYRPNGYTPPLFLQELAHLSSLACAVALSTLRNDVEGSESPLDMYNIPGNNNHSSSQQQQYWPVSDPDKLPREVRNEFQHRYHIFTIIRHWMGRDRIPEWRAHYNAARPLLVIGGVSNGEIKQLQLARGSHAKVTLAFGWLKEFIIREHLAGTLGPVGGGSALVSRIVQFISDGLLHYHQARKIMYIPFPFPHAQLSVFFSAIMIIAVPFLLDQYTDALWMGALLSFLTVTCLVGLHEVARELENPFRNVPNEIPLCTLQAMYNEALVIMFSGYNPDSFWDAELYQGALEALALGKVYQSQQEGEESERQQQQQQQQHYHHTAGNHTAPS